MRSPTTRAKTVKRTQNAKEKTPLRIPPRPKHRGEKRGRRRHRDIEIAGVAEREEPEKDGVHDEVKEAVLHHTLPREPRDAVARLVAQEQCAHGDVQTAAKENEEQSVCGGWPASVMM